MFPPFGGSTTTHVRAWWLSLEGRNSHFTHRGRYMHPQTCIYRMLHRRPELSTSSWKSRALNSTPGLQLGLLVYLIHSALREESACSSFLLAFALLGASLCSGFPPVIMGSYCTRADVDLDVPAIAVMGWQSAGKSSLIEAISGITLPRASGTCTGCTR